MTHHRFTQNIEAVKNMCVLELHVAFRHPILLFVDPRTQRDLSEYQKPARRDQLVPEHVPRSAAHGQLMGCILLCSNPSSHFSNRSNYQVRPTYHGQRIACGSPCDAAYSSSRATNKAHAFNR